MRRKDKLKLPLEKGSDRLYSIATKLQFIRKLAYNKNYFIFLILLGMPLNGYLIAQGIYSWGIFIAIMHYPYLIDLSNRIDWHVFHEDAQ